MNEVIELHDSELAAISVAEGMVVLSLRPAYIHRSAGRAGIDAGSGWVQDATLTVADASVSASAVLPTTVVEGEVHIGDVTHRDCIPTSGRFHGAVAVELLLSSGQRLIVRGSGLAIDVHGEPAYVEEFQP